MIPTIEDIIAGLIAGTMTAEQAEGYIAQHLEMAEGGLRDHFAGLAMQGWLASFDDSSPFPDPREIARLSYQMADAMMVARDE